jgi:hypothetical protein
VKGLETTGAENVMAEASFGSGGLRKLNGAVPVAGSENELGFKAGVSSGAFSGSNGFTPRRTALIILGVRRVNAR